MNELAKKLGPEYAALVYGLPKVDGNSQDAQDINATPRLTTTVTNATREQQKDAFFFSVM
jgi:hypothetical protein